LSGRASAASVRKLGGLLGGEGRLAEAFVHALVGRDLSLVGHGHIGGHGVDRGHARVAGVRVGVDRERGARYYKVLGLRLYRKDP
jgi:hypothetical protein